MSHPSTDSESAARQQAGSEQAGSEQAGSEQAGSEQAGEQALTDEVLASFETSPSARFREIMQSLVRHLHGFARDVRLTQQEWEAGVEFLARAGHITDDRRQEFILLSDVLGLSMQVVGINAPANAGATESTVFGPFFVDGAPRIELGGDIARGAKGTPCYVHGQVRSADGTPLPDARIDTWEADEDGLYDTQYPGDLSQGRGWLLSGSGGAYRFWSVLPVAYPIPHDGPVGELLASGNRRPMRPAHLHFKVTAPDHRPLITHVFVDGDKYLRSDAVFGVKDSLIGKFTEHDGGNAPDGTTREGRWTQVHFDLVLAKS